MEEFSLVLIILSIIGGIILLLLWIMLPIMVCRISGKMDEIIWRLDKIIGKIE